MPRSAYVQLLSVKNQEARSFYETEALRSGWSIRQLDRQIGSQSMNASRFRWFARGSAVLLFLFTAMTIGLSQFSYGVYAMSRGHLPCSTVLQGILTATQLVI